MNRGFTPIFDRHFSLDIDKFQDPAANHHPERTVIELEPWLQEKSGINSEKIREKVIFHNLFAV